MNRIARVAILRKVTFLEQLRNSSQSMVQGRSRLQAFRDLRVIDAHASHQKTTDSICSYLKSQRIAIRMKEQLTIEDIDWADLVMSVGGDGTFLRTSHLFHEFESTPILGINSSPESSFGFYCAANAETFPELFQNLQSGETQPRPIWRMQILINGEKHPVLALNDVLFAAGSAATTLYYTIRKGSQIQIQKSSGVWVATAAGSTAGILSSGGCILPWSSRHFQYRVRELFPPSIGGQVPIVGGFFEDDLELIPRMTSAKLYIDGCNRSATVGYNDSITFRPSEQPINWISSPMCDENRKNLQKLMQNYKSDLRKSQDEFLRQQSELLII
uniref:NAD(+) kinase n=1 Tax=Spongospora subterranea TaxID=70186 RepID=A0A0H5RS13_9EUKA|eukprot:CRZ11519.1 hypothetical protein [Spongospora subterranea]